MEESPKLGRWSESWKYDSRPIHSLVQNAVNYLPRKAISPAINPQILCTTWTIFHVQDVLDLAHIIGLAWACHPSVKKSSPTVADDRVEWPELKRTCK